MGPENIQEGQPDIGPPAVRENLPPDGSFKQEVTGTIGALPKTGNSSETVTRIHQTNLTQHEARIRLSQQSESRQHPFRKLARSLWAFFPGYTSRHRSPYSFPGPPIKGPRFIVLLGSSPTKRAGRIGETRSKVSDGLVARRRDTAARPHRHGERFFLHKLRLLPLSAIPRQHACRRGSEAVSTIRGIHVPQHLAHRVDPPIIPGGRRRTNPSDNQRRDPRRTSM